jgi:uncharacterized membrane protein
MVGIVPHPLEFTMPTATQQPVHTARTHPGFILAPMPTPTLIDMPGWRPIARHALTTIAIVSVLPMAIFYTTLMTVGLRPAVVTTVALYYVGLLVKHLRGKPVLAAALIAAGLLTLRTIVMFATGSAIIYFLQPVAATIAVATVFAATALAGRPVLDRLAHEFCPFPEELSERLRSGRFFSHLSAVWAAMYLANAAGTVWLLANASLGNFVLMKSLMSPLATLISVALSYALLRATLRKENVALRWAGATA